MISKPNKNDASTAVGSNARLSFWGIMLLSFGLLFNNFQSVMAAPGHEPDGNKKPAGFGCYNVSANVNLNNQIADGHTNDQVTIVVTDATTGLPVPGVTVQIQTVGVATPTTDASGTVVYGLANGSTSPPITLKITVANSCTVIPDQEFDYIPAPVVTNPPPGSPNPSYYTTIIASAPVSSAGGADTAVVQLHITDGTNNELPGTPVRFTVVGGTAQSGALLGGSINNPYVPAGGLGQNGSIDIPITDANAGTVIVEAEAWNGTAWVQVGSPQTVTFVAAPPTNNPPPGSPNPSYYITVIPTATANNASPTEVRLHLTDGTNNEPAGYPVEFDITSTNSASTNATMNPPGSPSIKYDGTIGANGNIDLPIIDPNSGAVTIVAWAYDYVTGKYDIPFGSQTVNFVAAPPTNNPPPGSSNPSTFTTIIAQATASMNPADTTVVQLHITDGTNNEPPGSQVRFYVTGGTAAATAVFPGGVIDPTSGAPYVTALAAGNTTGSIDIPITNPNPGTVIITAEAWDGTTWIPIGSPQTVTFVIPPPTNNPPPGSPNPSYYKTIIASATADGASPTEVELHITDGTNNEPDGYQVEFVITSSNTASDNAVMTGTGADKTTGTTPPLTTILPVGANGTIDIPITDVKTGSVTIEAYAYDPATGKYDIDFGSQTVTFVAGPPVSGDPGGGGSGGTPPGGGGTPPGGGGGTPPGGGGGTPPGGGGGTPPGGGGSNPGDGNNTGPGSNNEFTVLFVREPYDYRLSNGKDQDSLIAYISDANQNPVKGVSVTFFLQATPTSGTATSTAQIVGNTGGTITVTTDDSGYARIAITSTMPGTVFVDATIVDPKTGNTVLIDGSYQIAHFVTKPDVTNVQTALTVIVGEALADGVQKNIVKAHVVDIDGNVMPDQQVYFAVDSGTGTIVTPQPVTTDANGDAFIEITSKTVGYVLITAVVDSEKIIFGSPARTYFAAINIYVPRAFTPNNDGTNDILRPILVGIQSFHYFSVYNRWGNLIFTTQDPNQGWDGTFKGVPQPVETYLWIAEGIDENGRKVVARGMTSLVR